MSALVLHEVYDDQGNHLGGWLPPLMVDNVLTEDFHKAKAVRPASEWLSVRDRSEHPELGLVYMLPLGMKPGDTIPGDIIGAAVQLIDADKAVMIHADNPETARVVKAVRSRSLAVGTRNCLAVGSQRGRT